MTTLLTAAYHGRTTRVKLIVHDRGVAERSTTRRLKMVVPTQQRLGEEGEGHPMIRRSQSKKKTKTTTKVTTAPDAIELVRVCGTQPSRWTGRTRSVLFG
jgi:hypothetical protein